MNFHSLTKILCISAYISYHDIPNSRFNSISIPWFKLVSISWVLMIHKNNNVKAVHRFFSDRSKIRHILEITAEKFISQQNLFRPSGYPHRSFLSKQNINLQHQIQLLNHLTCLPSIIGI